MTIEDSRGDQFLAQDHSQRSVDFQDTDRCAADCSSSKQFRSVPMEMVRPQMTPGMKQSRVLKRLRVNSRQVRSLMSVTMKTGECKIGRYRPAAVYFCDDVVDLGGKFLNIFWGAPQYSQQRFARCQTSSSSVRSIGGH